MDEKFLCEKFKTPADAEIKRTVFSRERLRAYADKNPGVLFFAGEPCRICFMFTQNSEIAGFISLDENGSLSFSVNDDPKYNLISYDALLTYRILSDFFQQD